MTQQPDLLSRLQAATRELRLDVSAQQEERLLAYLDQLQRWNRTYNLTAIRDPEQMLSHHLLDSLAIVAPLRSQFASVSVAAASVDPEAGAANTEAANANANAEIASASSIPSATATATATATMPGSALDGRVIVDVGSGAGLPGVVLAIMHPGVTVHCVDTVEKKATFIRYVAGVLKLPNLQAHHARIESLPPSDADVVVSRAFASLLDFATLAGGHVRTNGKLMAMKGKEPTDEIGALHTATSWRVRGVEPLKVPGLDAERCVLWITDQGHS